MVLGLALRYNQNQHEKAVQSWLATNCPNAYHLFPANMLSRSIQLIQRKIHVLFT